MESTVPAAIPATQICDDLIKFISVSAAETLVDAGFNLTEATMKLYKVLSFTCIETLGQELTQIGQYFQSLTSTCGVAIVNTACDIHETTSRCWVMQVSNLRRIQESNPPTELDEAETRSSSPPSSENVVPSLFFRSVSIDKESFMKHIVTLKRTMADTSDSQGSNAVLDKVIATLSIDTDHSTEAESK